MKGVRWQRTALQEILCRQPNLYIASPLHYRPVRFCGRPQAREVQAGSERSPIETTLLCREFGTGPGISFKMEPQYMRRIVTGALVLGACTFLIPGIAGARPQYAQAFIKEHDIKADTPLGKAGCNICHSGADKKMRNAFGKEVEKALGGKTNVSPADFTTALKKAEAAVSADKKTKYGDLIKAGKLPGGG